MGNPKNTTLGRMDHWPCLVRQVPCAACDMTPPAPGRALHGGPRKTSDPGQDVGLIRGDESHATRALRVVGVCWRFGHTCRNSLAWRALRDLVLHLSLQIMRCAVNFALPGNTLAAPILRAQLQTPVFRSSQRRRDPSRTNCGPAIAIILGTLFALPVTARAQAIPEFCEPLIPPSLPSDDYLMREFEDLLREEFDQYLSGVTRYFRCLDAERAHALREAAEVTTQYAAFLEALRRAPP